MSIPLQTLVNDTRVLSDTVNNYAAVTDTNVAMLVSDAGSELYDDFTAQNQHYNIKTLDFTLSGGVGDTDGVNSKILPDDFQQGHGLELNPGTTTPISVKALDNWLDRNQGNNWGYLAFTPGPVTPRNYCFSGSLLKVFPVQNAAGTYRLYYTPLWTPLALPYAIPPAVSTVPAIIASIGISGAFSFTGANWQQANLGDTFIVAGATNSANNGPRVITAIGGTNVITAGTATVIELTTAATATIQPAGTLSALPVQMNSWDLYMKVHAAIAIKTKRDQNVDALEAKLAGLKARILSILTNRREEPSQPPLTRGCGYGLGGGWDY